MLAGTAYLVRGLQLVLGTSKRALTERAEEMGNEDDDIPLAHRGGDSSNTPEVSSPAPSTVTLELPDQISEPVSPPRTQDSAQVRGTGGPPEEAQTLQEPSIQPTMRQDTLPPTRAQRWAVKIDRNLDIFTYSTTFLLIGIPVYYTTGYAMPVQLSLNILAYFAALSLPSKYKQYLHPVLVASAITILGIWILALCRGDTLREGLLAYTTKTRYLQLWKGDKGLHKPGAGDIFSSVLDVSIVALALPMFQYRKELRRHAISILLPSLTLSTASLFSYPPLCHTLGISPQRSLSFAARSLTLALATPATSNLGGDLNLVAVLCIMSGILGVLVGPTILRLLRIPEGQFWSHSLSVNMMND
ncbi:MAG: hypothetical protein M1812_001308 [Candelaria pacifica]|nr:MAG: hypothetical protein M1812_001308 [Candelaria pacifica]